MSIRVEVFVDFVCPYCYLAESAIKHVKQVREVEIIYRPVELRPAPIPTLRPEDEYLPRVWQASVYPIARRLGVDIKLPTISPQPRTEAAFLLLQLAQEVGVDEAYVHAVFRAFFEHDRDIGNAKVLLELATGVGIDPVVALEALSSDQRRWNHAAKREAAHSGAIRSVPTIRIGDQTITGMADAATLLQAVDAATEPTSAS
ncbi:DsbA family protein [Leifsonia aquatica]|uniref:DsbA family protein n=1 Tax=Leifsonia aquatica TaxID=144185 RepID=UPI003850C9FF